MTLENRGNAAAEDLHFRFEVTDGDQAAAPTVMEADEAIRLLPEGHANH
jgi:hypothetical protein